MGKFAIVTTIKDPLQPSAEVRFGTPTTDIAQQGRMSVRCHCRKSSPFGDPGMGVKQELLLALLRCGYWL
jgi:hypothetical protein